MRVLSIVILVAVSAVSAGACSHEGGATGPDDGEPPPSPNELQCDVDRSRFVDGGVGLGAIPALQDPQLVAPGEPGSEFLESPDEAGTANIREHDRVIVFSYGGLGVSRFQISGLPFSDNLVMRDPDTGSLWPQMTRAAGCGPSRGRSLTVVPSIETRWEERLGIHPDTRVVSSRTGFRRNYERYPYHRYEEPNSPPLADVRRLDRRRSARGELSTGCLEELRIGSLGSPWVTPAQL